MRDTPTKPSAETVTAVSAAINALLAEAFAFYHRATVLDGHLSAAQSREYRFLQDEQAEQILAITDELANRVREMGGTALIGQITHVQHVISDDEEIVSPLDMLRRLVTENKALAVNMRKAHAVADEKDDMATTRLLETLIGQVERRTGSLLKAGRAAEAGQFPRSSRRRVTYQRRLSPDDASPNLTWPIGSGAPEFSRHK